MSRIASSPPDPKVSIVILNWNGLADTLECLHSLEVSDFPNQEIIVVDNGSTDGSQATLREKKRKFVLIETGENLGYAEGNNVGIRHALENAADYILVLNNDTIVASDMVSRLVDVSITHPNAILGPLTFYDHEPDRIWWAGTLWRDSKFAFIHRADGELASTLHYEALEPCDYVVGSALFAPASVFASIGLFDKRFFLTFEETDFCYRARADGWKCFCATEARLWHKVSATMGGTGSPLQHYFYVRNALLWGERHLKKKAFVGLLWRTLRDVFNPGIVGNEISLRRYVWALKSISSRVTGNNAHPVTRAKLLGLKDYVLRRFGNCPQTVRELNSSTKKAV